MNRRTKRILQLAVSGVMGVLLLSGCGGGGGGDEGKRWRSAVQISEEGGGTPHVVMDEEGNPLIVWIKEIKEIYSRRYKGGWESVVKVYEESNPNYWIVRPSLAGNGEGDAVLSWEAGGHAVYVARYDAEAGTWSSVVNLKSSGESRANGYTHAAIDEAGNAWVVWSQYLDEDSSGNKRYDIYGSYFKNSSGSWGTPERVGSASSRLDVPDLDLVIKPEGAAVVWNSTGATQGGQSSIVKLARRDANGWHEESIGSATDMNRVVRYPRITENADVDTMVVWLMSNENPNAYQADLYSSFYERAENSWEKNLPVDAESEDVVRARVVTGPGGVPVAVWSASDENGTRRIWMARFDRESGEWKDKTAISGPDQDAEGFDIAMNESGDLFAVWMEGDTGYFRIKARSLSLSTGRWSREVVLNGDFAKQGVAPDVAVDPQGNAVVAWKQQLEDDSWRVYARFFR